MVQYLLNQGIPPENILTSGHSLGGAVGAEVASYHEGMHHCNDRSLSTLTDFVKTFFSTIADEFAKIPKSVKLNAAEDKRKYADDSPELSEKIERLKAALDPLSRERITWTDPLASVVGKLVWLSGHHFDSVRRYDEISGHKFIIYCKEDGVIRYPASLYKGHKRLHMTSADRKLKKKRTEAKKRGESSPKNYSTEYKPKHFKRAVFSFTITPEGGEPRLVQGREILREKDLPQRAHGTPIPQASLGKISTFYIENCRLALGLA